MCLFSWLFRSPEPKAHWWAYSIGMHQSYVVRCPSSVNIFKHLLIRSHFANLANFTVEPPWVWGTVGKSSFKWSWSHEKNGRHAHIRLKLKKKKNKKKTSSLEPNSRLSWNLICSIGYLSTTKFLQMMILGWPLTFLRKVIFGSLCIYMGKCLNGGLLRNYWSLWYKSWYI